MMLIPIGDPAMSEYSMYVCPECRKVFKVKRNSKTPKCPKCVDFGVCGIIKKKDEWDKVNTDTKKAIVEANLVQWRKKIDSLNNDGKSDDTLKDNEIFWYGDKIQVDESTLQDEDDSYIYCNSVRLDEKKSQVIKHLPKKIISIYLHQVVSGYIFVLHV